MRLALQWARRNCPQRGVNRVGFGGNCAPSKAEVADHFRVGDLVDGDLGGGVRAIDQAKTKTILDAARFLAYFGYGGAFDRTMGRNGKFEYLVFSLRQPGREGPKTV